MRQVKLLKSINSYDKVNYKARQVKQAGNN